MDKRRDNKNRVLKAGEIQRSDGRYVFTYMDQFGDRKYLYSWKLVPRDPVPTGKRAELSLREKEEEIENCIRNGIAPLGGDIDVITLVKKYITTKTGVRQTTKTGYNTVVNWLEKDSFGKRRIDTVSTSDAKIWLITLQEKQGKSYSTIHTIRGVLRPAFQMAVDDDYIRKNPFDFQLCTVIVNDSVTRDAVSREDERKFLNFAQNDSHYSRYYDGFYILFNTGMRISEFVGLTLGDIDFKEKTINIDHQLLRNSHSQYYIEETKTNAGTRVIPMTDDVAECFKRIIAKRKKVKTEKMIDGYTGFIFLDKNGNPEVANHWEKHFQWCRERYNSIYKIQLPTITPHVCRHTYCSKMAKSGMNPKILQYLMGHSDISVTLNTYTHVKFDDAVNEIKKLAVNK